VIKLYGIRNCDSCRKAIKWLKAHDVEHEFVNIREDKMDENTLIRWQESLGWEALLNKRSITWRKIPAFDRGNLDSATARQLILQHPTVMKRPVLDTGKRLVLGFDASAYADLDL
jgi:arsenate reductase